MKIRFALIDCFRLRQFACSRSFLFCSQFSSSSFLPLLSLNFLIEAIFLHSKTRTGKNCCTNSVHNDKMTNEYLVHWAKVNFDNLRLWQNSLLSKRMNLDDSKRIKKKNEISREITRIICVERLSFVQIILFVGDIYRFVNQKEICKPHETKRNRSNFEAHRCPNDQSKFNCNQKFFFSLFFRSPRLLFDWEMLTARTKDGRRRRTKREKIKAEVEHTSFRPNEKKSEGDTQNSIRKLSNVKNERMKEMSTFRISNWKENTSGEFNAYVARATSHHRPKHGINYTFSSTIFIHFVPRCNVRWSRILFTVRGEIWSKQKWLLPKTSDR